MRKTGFARRRPAPALGEIPPWARKPPEKAPLIKKGSLAAGRRQLYAKKTTGAREKILLDKKGYFPPRAAPAMGEKNSRRAKKNTPLKKKDISPRRAPVVAAESIAMDEICLKIPLDKKGYFPPRAAPALRR